MDLVASCKEKLAYFRIKELKDVLTKLGLSKQGKKQDLVERIFAILSDEKAARLGSKKEAVAREKVAKLVNDAYRRMQASGASDSPSKGQVSSDISNVKAKEELEDSFQPDVKVRCICGSSLETESMIQCEDPRCHVWEHVGCVIIPEKPMGGNPPLPDSFFCEICRLTRADPFWLTVAHRLFPVRLTATNIPTDGTNPMQSVDKTFQITRTDKDLLVKQEYDVQAWCMLLNDKVLFRMQWPHYADLQVNGVPFRAINRPGSQLLGANGRDDGPIITPCIRDGINKISLSGCDSRSFCLGVRLVKRRSLQQVLNMIPEEAKGEPFEVALTRVRRCIGGAAGNDNADIDSDIDVVADFFGVNLRCPMSGSRMKVAGRFKPCLHMGCFDLEVFVELNQCSRKWQCPICLKNYSLEHIIVDPYFNRITSKMRHLDEELTEIEMKPDGSWRGKFKNESELRDLGVLSQWHKPDGNLFPMVDEIKPKLEMQTSVKQEGCSDGPTPLELGIRKNLNGIWEVRKPNNNGLSSSNRQEKLGYQELNVIPMSSSATGSGKYVDDPSVNQDALGSFDFGNNGMELDSLSLNVARSQTKSPFHRVGNGGLICLLKKCLVESKTKPLECSTSLLSGHVDHFQSTKEDNGWGCGWRNIQMQCSHLLFRRDGEEAKRVLFGGCNVVPDIPSLQRWLELAWKNGFDVSGGLHFGNRIYGCKKWIGTTECAALLRSLGLRARVVDFAPANKREKEVDTRGSSSSRISKGAVLMKWVWNYFSDNRLDVSSGVHITNKGPLYFQHEGHSRTIVGIQRRLQGTTFTPQYNLLILDPADFTRDIEKALVEKKGWEGYFKRGAQTLTCPEYQILYVDNGIALGEELEQLKTIDSQFVEF